MSLQGLDRWKHCTVETVRPQEQHVGVDLFDDEQAGFVSIYVRYADGKRWPTRSINVVDHPELAAKVLKAWAQDGPVHDYRQQRVLSYA